MRRSGSPADPAVIRSSARLSPFCSFCSLLVSNLITQQALLHPFGIPGACRGSTRCRPIWVLLSLLLTWQLLLCSCCRSSST